MKFKKIALILLLLCYPIGMLLTVAYYQLGYPESIAVAACSCILMLICVLWTGMYGIVGNYQHFKELRLRFRRKIGNYNKATWTAWVLVNLIQPILTIAYIVWYFNRFF